MVAGNSGGINRLVQPLKKLLKDSLSQYLIIKFFADIKPLQFPKKFLNEQYKSPSVPVALVFGI